MKKLLFVSVLLVYSVIFAQEKPKTAYLSPEIILNSIIPNDKTDFWTLIYNEYARDHVRKSVGKGDYLPQFKGFSIDPHQEGFYYIAYSRSGKTDYVTDLQSLSAFIGTIDNPEEAALAAIAGGYSIDFEFKEYAANYQDFGTYYLVEAGKVTTEKCPLAKNHYLLSIDKKSGSINDVKDLGQYFEIYGKDCKNNPHHSAIDKQMEQARLKAEEQKKIQKEISDKMERRIRKIQNKRR